ncbi:hypothetical protein HY224_03015 [Candidatus Uhrbacteria bacterium]|nr:hypothetical protein [Candidatus Uhrbacteria bacterium]
MFNNIIPDIKNPSPSPAAVILTILASKPRISIKDCYEFFTRQYQNSFTLQGFYKVISQLVEQRILIKEGKTISVDASWIYNLEDFLQILKRYYFHEAAAVNILLQEGESQTFTFERVMDMDNFWTHALIVICQYYTKESCADKNVYVHNAHSWFQLARTGQEQALVDAYAKNKVKLYHVTGSLSFLDSLVYKFIEGDNINYTEKIIPQFGPNYYGNIVGDFFIQTSLPKYIHEQMEKIYEKTTTLSEFNANDIISLIKQPARTVLTLTRDRKRASEFRKVIKGCFGK